MIPSIPDKIYKLFIAVGLIISIYFYLETNKIKNQISSNEDKIFELTNNMENEFLKTIKFEKFILKKSKDISKFYGIENAIEKINDTTVTFVSYIYSKDKIKQKYNDSLVKLWDEYTKNNNEMEYKKANFRNKVGKLYSINSKLEKKAEDNLIIAVFGIFGFFIGVYIWTLDENLEEYKKAIVKIQDKIYRNCQSCGMKFTSVRKYGTNKDKSESNAFCEDCFEKGEFTNPDLTIEEVKKNAKPFIKGNFISKRLKINNLNRLERFNRNQYFD